MDGNISTHNHQRTDMTPYNTISFKAGRHYAVLTTRSSLWLDRTLPSLHPSTALTSRDSLQPYLKKGSQCCPKNCGKTLHWAVRKSWERNIMWVVRYWGLGSSEMWNCVVGCVVLTAWSLPGRNIVLLGVWFLMVWRDGPKRAAFLSHDTTLLCNISDTCFDC
jgi:hypothetical protein